MTKKSILQRGQAKILAEAAGLRVAYLSDILHRRRGVGFHLAKRLEKASDEVLGMYIPATVWLHNKTSTHPIFK